MKKPDKSLIDVIIPFNGMWVLEIDIETKPHLGYFFDLFNQNMGLNQIVEPGGIICFDARWQHETKHMFLSVEHDGRDVMVEKLWDLLDQCDVVIHFNGKRFDIPHINRVFLEDEYFPPSPYQHIDLYHVVRSTFKFMSNKFDHIVDRLFGERKLEHEGFGLWRKCMDHEKASWKIMKEYNMHDTALLRPTYLRLQPWIKQHPNRGLYVADTSKPVCPNCGAIETMRIKAYRSAEPGVNTAKTRVNVFPQYICDPNKKDKKSKLAGCGTYSRARISIKRDRTGIMT